MMSANNSLNHLQCAGDDEVTHHLGVLFAEFFAKAFLLIPKEKRREYCDLLVTYLPKRADVEYAVNRYREDGVAIAIGRRKPVVPDEDLVILAQSIFEMWATYENSDAMWESLAVAGVTRKMVQTWVRKKLIKPPPDGRKAEAKEARKQYQREH